jgi:4-hydroxy-tetrahydrodipicolinate reductase
MTEPIPVAIFGRSGRMAKALARQVADSSDLRLVVCLPARRSSASQIAAALDRTPPETIVCDFTNRAAFRKLVAALGISPRKLVTGTSGLSAQDHDLLAILRRDIALVHAANFCLGAYMVGRLIDSLGSMLRHNPAWDAALLDFHHARKLDPISATAKAWMSAWSEASGKSDAPVAAIRLGDGISEHTLLVAGAGERIEIVHKAQSLDAPVSGVLATLRFLASRGPGAHTLADVLDMPTAVPGAPGKGREMALSRA